MPAAKKARKQVVVVRMHATKKARKLERKQACIKTHAVKKALMEIARMFDAHDRMMLCNQAS